MRSFFSWLRGGAGGGAAQSSEDGGHGPVPAHGVEQASTSGTPPPLDDPPGDPQTPVLLIPGIGGTMIGVRSKSTGKEERAWVVIEHSDAEFREKLWCKYNDATGMTEPLDPDEEVFFPTGTEKDESGLYCIDILDPDVPVRMDVVYYYHDMIVDMKKNGRVEGKTLFGFGYDFRQTNRLAPTLDALAAKIERISQLNGGSKVHLVSHSMGGLLTKCLLAEHPDVFGRLVDTWVAVAAPFEGAPGFTMDALVSGTQFVSGWEQYWFINRWSMHQMLQECPSVYELMPRADFPWDTPPGLTIWREGAAGAPPEEVRYDVESFYELLTELLQDNGVSHDGAFIDLPYNPKLRAVADTTREVLARAKLPDTCQFYNIYGVGWDTPHTVEYGTQAAPVASLKNIEKGGAAYGFVRGDGTVPAQSAAADGMPAQARLAVETKTKGDHLGLLQCPQVLGAINEWLAPFGPLPPP